LKDIQTACWTLLEHKGLSCFNGEAVAQEANLPLHVVLDLCPKNSHFLKLLWCGVIEQTQPIPQGLSPHDTMFEGSMCLLDALTGKEKAVKNLLHDLPLFPSHAKAFEEILEICVKNVFEKANLSLKGPKFVLKGTIYKVFLLGCLKTWCNDETDHKSGTLSYVDNTLTTLENYYSMAKKFLGEPFRDLF
jgi:hypothetical protein